MKTIHLLTALIFPLSSTRCAITASFPVASIPAVLVLSAVAVMAQEDKNNEDDNAHCEGWAENGECSLNPRYMAQNCPQACGRQLERDRELAEHIEEKIGHINSFFELEAADIDQKVLEFDQFRGKVTVITNVASHCGYTESHYTGLVQLNNRFKASAVGFNILAFPCNQFGEQEPEKCPAIKRFAKSKGVEFTMMDKIDVNDFDAHLVYDYLKKVAGPPRITWNFATYYVVTPGGSVTSHSGVEPLDLVPAILKAMGANDSSDDDSSDDGSTDNGQEL